MAAGIVPRFIANNFGEDIECTGLPRVAMASLRYIHAGWTGVYSSQHRLSAGAHERRPSGRVTSGS